MNEMELILRLNEMDMLINNIEYILNSYTGKTAVKKALKLIEQWRKGDNE